MVPLEFFELFPEIASRMPTSRLLRAEGIAQRFFGRTLTFTADGLPFIITGDIPAMWLRDSTWQVAPFLRSQNVEVAELLAGISMAQIKYFLIDPYANAFNPTPSGNCWHKDFVDQSPWVFERKYELDSWASILFLARRIHEQWGISRHLGDHYLEAVSRIIEVAAAEQVHQRNGYRFLRSNGIAHDSLSHDGYGAPTGYTGMVFSAFRPSDDACQYGYLVPANLFFLNELKLLDESHRPESLISEIESGIQQFAVSASGYAYEVDGLGNQLLIDDANLPSLLSLPYLGVCSPAEPLYAKTRSRILSSQNPYFYSGEFARGIGSQHTPPNFAWPIAIAIEGLTRSSERSVEDVLVTLESTDAGTEQMHESFDVQDPADFTREWFSWADAMYLELLIREYGMT